jgi:hypothetical protein
MQDTLLRLVNLLLIVVGCTVFAASSIAIADPELAKIAATITTHGTGAEITKASLTETQANTLIAALMAAGNHFVSFKFSHIKKISHNTHGVIAAIGASTKIRKLDLSGTYLSDLSMNALIQLLTEAGAARNHGVNPLNIVVLNEAKASTDNWVKFFQSLEKNHKIRELSVRDLRDESGEPIEDERVFDALEQSLGSVKQLNLDVSSCGFLKGHDIEQLQGNCQDLVTLTCDGEVATICPEGIVSFPAPDSSQNAKAITAQSSRISVSAQYGANVFVQAAFQFLWPNQQRQ